jgi:hypothetical protein
VPGVEEVGEEVDNVEPNHFQGIMEGLLAPDSYPTSHFQTDVLRIIQSIPVDMPPQFVDPSQVSLGGGFLTEGGFPYPSSCTDNLYHLVTRSRDSPASTVLDTTILSNCATPLESSRLLYCMSLGLIN